MDFRVSLLHKVSTACASCCVSAYFRAEKHQSQRTCTLLAPFCETPLVVRFSFFLFTPKRSKADVLLHHDRDGFVDNRAHLPRARADARGRRATHGVKEGANAEDRHSTTSNGAPPIRHGTGLHSNLHMCPPDGVHMSCNSAVPRFRRFFRARSAARRHRRHRSVARQIGATPRDGTSGRVPHGASIRLARPWMGALFRRSRRG